jgi:DNA-binding NarL/FixJ family response regulator
MPLADEQNWQKIVLEIESFLQAPAEVAAHDSLPLQELTPQERNILEGIAGGLDNNEIAQSLGISEKTVRNNITRVFGKIGVEHRYQAIVRARDAGLGRRLKGANYH